MLFDALTRIKAMAGLTFLSGLKRHAIGGLILLTLAAEVSGLFFMDFISRDIGRAVSDFVISIGWISGLIFIFFHAVQAVAWDERGGSLFCFLARPVSRNEYVLGAFSGLCLLLLFFNVVAGTIGWAIIMMVKQMVTVAYFSGFSHSIYILSWLGIFAMEMMIISMIMLFSGLVRGGFTVLILSLSFYLICSGLPVVREALENRLVTMGSESIMPQVLKGLALLFPSFDRLDFKDYTVLTDGLMAHPEMALNFFVSFLYIAVVLWVACVVYSKRDLQ